MSFYGHILYEFTKLFSKFNFTNQDEDVATLQADDAWEQLNLNTGDRWLKFSVSGEEPNERTVNLTHEAPAEAIDQKFTYFEHLTEVPAEPEQLYGGDYVAINTETTHDEKGHLNSTQSITNYRLPKVVMTTTEPEEESENDELWFTTVQEDTTTDPWIKIEISDDREKITFSHIGPSSDEKVESRYEFKVNDSTPTDGQQLHCGDEIQLLKHSSYDSTGHLIENSQRAYKLPKPQFKLPNGTPFSLTENDEFNISGDGKWIDVAPDDSILTFSHKVLPGEEVDTITSGFEMVEPDKELTVDENEITNGMPNDSQAYYKDNLLQNGVGVYRLHPGELIKIRDTAIDTAGHITQNTPKYIKLPISADTAMFESNKARIDDLEGRLNKGEEKVAYEEVLDNIYNEETGLNVKVEKLEETTVQKDGFTGELSEMYTDYPEETELKTFAKTIGIIDSNDNSVVDTVRKAINTLKYFSNDTIDKPKADEIYSLSRAIYHLTNSLNYLGDRIEDMKSAQAGLSGRIAVVENMLDIE